MAPGYLNASVAGLTQTDTRVLHAVCDDALARDDQHADVAHVTRALEAHGLTEEQIRASLARLMRRNFIEEASRLEGRLVLVQPTPYGFEAYATQFVPDFPSIVQQILVTVAMQPAMHSQDVVHRVGHPPSLVHWVLKLLAGKDFIKMEQPAGSGAADSIIAVTPEGKRQAGSR